MSLMMGDKMFVLWCVTWSVWRSATGSFGRSEFVCSCVSCAFKASLCVQIPRLGPVVESVHTDWLQQQGIQGKESQ